MDGSSSQRGTPCSGHECDGCPVCLRGRCCRADDAAYRLPRLGEWNGAIFGTLGTVSRPLGDLAECHACGKLYAVLGLHAWRSHDLTPAEYRSIFGFGSGAHLTGATYEATAARHTRRRLQDGQLRAIDGPYTATREQLQDRAQRVAERNRTLGRESNLASANHRLRVDEGYRQERYARSGQRYLSPDERNEIRGLYPNSTMRELADAYGVSVSRIHRVIRTPEETRGRVEAVNTHDRLPPA